MGQGEGKRGETGRRGEVNQMDGEGWGGVDG